MTLKRYEQQFPERNFCTSGPEKILKIVPRTRLLAIMLSARRRSWTRSCTGEGFAAPVGLTETKSEPSWVLQNLTFSDFLDTNLVFLAQLFQARFFLDFWSCAELQGSLKYSKINVRYYKNKVLQKSTKASQETHFPQNFNQFREPAGGGFRIFCDFSGIRNSLNFKPGKMEASGACGSHGELQGTTKSPRALAPFNIDI